MIFLLVGIAGYRRRADTGSQRRDRARRDRRDRDRARLLRRRHAAQRARDVHRDRRDRRCSRSSSTSSGSVCGSLAPPRQPSAAKLDRARRRSRPTRRRPSRLCSASRVPAIDAGYPTADLEVRVLSLAGALGLSGHGGLRDARRSSRSRSDRFPTSGATPCACGLATVDLDASRGSTTSSRTSWTTTSAPTMRSSLSRTSCATSRCHRPWPILLAAYAVAGAALTPVLGGGWREAAAAAVVGLVVGAIALTARQTARTERDERPSRGSSRPASAPSRSSSLGIGGSPDRRHTRRARDVPPRHDADDRHARARDRASPVRRREHGERARPALRSGVRRRDRPVGRRSSWFGSVGTKSRPT